MDIYYYILYTHTIYTHRAIVLFEIVITLYVPTGYTLDNCCIWYILCLVEKANSCYSKALYT